MLNAQEKYLLKDKSGNEIPMETIVQKAQESPYVFFGELHDNAECHQLELLLLQELQKQYGSHLILGMEMFETDVQHIVDEYFSGLIKTKSFETESRVWSNYSSDYKPLLEFAKENNIKLIASNIPRRYANAVYHQGLDVLGKLPKSSLKWIAPLPLKIKPESKIYQEMRAMLPDHDSQNMIASQALKDATMANSILKNTKRNSIFLHINGAFHSKNKEGIIDYLVGIPLEKILCIQTIKAEDFKSEDLSSADYTFIVQ